jgi:hypothetical protein
MIKKVIVAISIILVVLLSSVGFLYAADNSNNKTYHVTASSNNGGTITPEGNQPVQKGNGINSNISKFFVFFHNLFLRIFNHFRS